MRGFIALMLVALVAVGVVYLGTQDGSIDLAELTDPGLVERSRSAEATAWAANGTAEAIRLARRETELARLGEATQEAMRKTAEQAEVFQAAGATATQQTWNATATAGNTQATATAEAAGVYLRWTQEAINRQATADAAGASAMATSQSVQASMAEEQLAQERIRTEMQDWTKRAWAGLPFFIILCLITALGCAALYFQRVRVIPLDQVAVIDGKVIIPNRSLWPWLDPKHPLLPSAGDQMRVTENHQKVQAVQALAQSGRSSSATRIATGITQAAAAPVAEPTASDALPVDVPWRWMDRWQGGKFMLGLGAGGGMIEADPNSAAPHLLMAGTSGSGKTRYGLRPVIAEALADDWQVIILDRSGVDFAIFEAHSNAYLVQIDEATQVIGYLKAAYGELVRRLRRLTEAGETTWGRWNGRSEANQLIVIDEFSNLADDLVGGEREELWRRARMIAAEGRKAGMLLAIALQDPTHKSIDLRIRRNCTRIAFKVQDADASRVILGTDGAERLQDRHFMTVLGTLQEGVAFNPSDPEISAFFSSRPRPAVLPAPGWIQTTKVEESEAVEKRKRILELHANGVSMNEIQRQLFGFTGGAAYEAVRAVLQVSTTEPAEPKWDAGE